MGDGDFSLNTERTGINFNLQSVNFADGESCSKLCLAQSGKNRGKFIANDVFVLKF